MEPNQKQLSPEEQRIKDEKYAQALVAMSNMELKMQTRHEAPQKHFISKKKLIYIGVSIVLTILSLFITPLNPFASSPDKQGSDTTQQLLNATQELQDLNTAE